MQFIDLKTQYAKIKKGVDARILNVLEHGKYIMGPEVKELENELSSYTSTDFCISCSSGTDALLMPLMAWDIGPGDAVFTTPFTFISTAEVIQLLGATPVFVDIDPVTYNLDPEHLEDVINKIISEGKLNPKAVIPVDLFGLPADYERIAAIAAKFELYVIEDAAQSFGGSIKDSKAGSFGHVASTSFFPAKPLGCYGDGGAIFTNDQVLKDKLESIRIHGKGTDKYNNIRIGLNARFDTIQAAVLLEKLSIFDEEITLRQKVSAAYTEKLKNKVVTPFIPDGYRSAWAQYSVQADSSEHRQEIMSRLNANGVPTAVYYPLPLHLQEAFKHLGYSDGEFPVTEQISQKIFSLPMHPYLDLESIDKITNWV